MNVKVLAGFVLAFLIGIGCRLAGVPLPAPPVLIGALLVVAMTIGYMLTDKYASQRIATQKQYCAGPTGDIPSQEGRR